ncbi:MAG: metal ABC transporter substrate-binding protein [Candidatus Aureabacteria bacterium]|nr:metal ABC transporter substrate-binding protein [Candidatus Auribacterota bacterium]
MYDPYPGFYHECGCGRQFGCPHDYALTPQDMQKLARADVLVVNGLGMEEFLGAPVEKANPKLTIVDSSRGIKETLTYTDREKDEYGGHAAGGDDHRVHHNADDREHASAGVHAYGNDRIQEHHRHTGPNPHLFASPRMATMIAAKIAGDLGMIDPAGAGTYSKNAAAYAVEMNRLTDDLAKLGKALKNNRIVTQHGVFDYLARDMGLEIVAVIQAHAGQEPSAAEMLKIVKTITQKKAGALFIEPQYPSRIGQTIAKEAGIPVAILDPVATGPADAGNGYYETVMRWNMETLKKTLGTK